MVYLLTTNAIYRMYKLVLCTILNAKKENKLYNMNIKIKNKRGKVLNNTKKENGAALRNAVLETNQ